MSARGARDVALDVLVRVEQGAFANVALPAVLRRTSLDARERAQATDLVYGTLRRLRSVDHLLSLALDRPLARLEPPVRAALRMGAHQLVDGVPAHAVVDETVRAIGRRTPRARGFVKPEASLLADGLLPDPLHLDEWDWPFAAGDVVRGVVVASDRATAVVQVGDYRARLSPGDIAWTRRSSLSDVLPRGTVAPFRIVLATGNISSRALVKTTFWFVQLPVSESEQFFARSSSSCTFA